MWEDPHTGQARVNGNRRALQRSQNRLAFACGGSAASLPAHGGRVSLSGCILGSSQNSFCNLGRGRSLGQTSCVLPSGVVYCSGVTRSRPNPAMSCSGNGMMMAIVRLVAAHPMQWLCMLLNICLCNWCRRTTSSCCSSSPLTTGRMLLAMRYMISCVAAGLDACALLACLLMDGFSSG